MPEEKPDLKIAQRKFAVPSLGVILAVVNDAAGLGLGPETIRLVVWGTVAMAGILTIFDVAKLWIGAKYRA